MLSIRFSTYESAQIFVALVQRYPPLPDHHAYLAEEQPAEGSSGGTESLLEILGGAQQSR
jgi:hypothetical protein